MGNFDKQVKKQAESFSLEPRKEVWKSLEVELGKAKKRRFATWLWVLPVALLAGMAIFYYSTLKLDFDDCEVAGHRGKTLRRN